MMLTSSPMPQKGLTLIELMIALVLGLLLVAGTIQVFIANKQTNRVTEAHSRLQDNARFALEILSRDIRSAGYSGCRAIEKMNVQVVADAPVPAKMSAQTMITGTEGTSTAIVSATLGTVVTGTDTITIQRGTSCGATLTGNTGASNGNIQVVYPNSCNINAEDILMIADCEDAHIFRASNTPGTGGGTQTITHVENFNDGTHLCIDNESVGSGTCGTGNAKLYNYDAELFTFTAVTYFIRNGTNGTPALWSFDLTTDGATPLELVEGIENLQVEYGVDDGDDDIVDRYENAKTIDDATEWDKVISARISILAQTTDANLTTANQTLTYNGASITIPNGRLARVFTSTIGIRNRVQ